MKAQAVINQLALKLPTLTDKFTTNFSVTSLTRSGTTVTATTSSAHGLVPNNQVRIIGAQTPIVISTLTRAGTIGTLVTASDHDMTEGFSTQVEISGATESEFNGTFTLLTVPNRRTVTFTMADSGATTATGSPLLLNGSSFLKDYNGLHKVTSTPTTTTFTYEVTDSTLFTPAAGTTIARTLPRISGCATAEFAVDAYEKKGANEYWAFVILGDVVASKSRETDSDAVAMIQRSNQYRQQLIFPVSVLVFIPTSGEILARSARDEAQDLFRPLCQSLISKEFDSGLFAGAQNPMTFVDHGFFGYNKAFYIHTYNFQSVADITFDDTIGYDDDVAFRDVELNMTLDLGTKEDPVTANIDLDDTIL